MLDSHLIHRCAIQRATRTLDAYGNAVETWSDAATNVACRLVAKTKTVFVGEQAEKAVIVTHTLLVRRDADLRDRDRISQVTYEDGTVETRTFAVESLLNRRSGSLHHKSAALSVVQ